jgi:hypothetical protein
MVIDLWIRQGLAGWNTRGDRPLLQYVLDFAHVFLLKACNSANLSLA